MHRMSSGVVLRNDWSVGCVWIMCSWFILVKLVFNLYFMRYCHLCRRFWFKQLHRLQQWSFIELWCIKLFEQLHRMQRGHLLVLGLRTMHELRGGQIQCDYGDDKLLFVLGRNFSSLNRVECMQCL